MVCYVPAVERIVYSWFIRPLDDSPCCPPYRQVAYSTAMLYMARV